MPASSTPFSVSNEAWGISEWSERPRARGIHGSSAPRLAAGDVHRRRQVVGLRREGPKRALLEVAHLAIGAEGLLLRVVSDVDEVAAHHAAGKAK